jgi:hypothetical protein
MHKKYLMENLKGRDHVEDLGTDVNELRDQIIRAARCVINETLSSAW